MNFINRFSSRRQRLSHTFLKERLKGARSYKRIAGYFRSSIFELVGEEISHIPKVQMVCNSELSLKDLAVAKYVRETGLKERWNKAIPEVEALLHKERYAKLYELLTSGRVEIKVVPKDKIFIHGKAGVIELIDGTKTCFLGSINETKSAFEDNYEIVWEDTSEEGVRWVEEEFEALWNDPYAFPLPEAILEEIKRISERVEVKISDLSPKEVPGAAFAEAPIYRGGEILQPWQRSFVSIFLEHRQTYQKARLLLADEVGLGKTLSLGVAGIIASLLGDGPVLILCPAPLTLQWQTELLDKLGVPSMVWSSQKKSWIDEKGREIRTRGPEDIAKCPVQIGIVSTGIIFQETEEKRHLLDVRFGTVILDEAHRARRRGSIGRRDTEPNNLLEFMLKIAQKTKHLLLGTATPIQTEVYELWDLLRILNQGVDFVLGKELLSKWANWKEALPFIKGQAVPVDEKEAWEFYRNPLPPGQVHELFYQLRFHLGIPDDRFFTDKSYSSLEYFDRQLLAQTLEPNFVKTHNPVVRHTVLRRRKTIEDLGMLPRIGVNVHPDSNAPPGTYGEITFLGYGLATNLPFELAYEAAEKFLELRKARDKKAALLKPVLLQRICSSFFSGRLTAERILRGYLKSEDEEDDLSVLTNELTAEERIQLERIVDELSRKEARDPKIAAVEHFLKNQISEGKTWLEHGCVIFSQYFDSVTAVAKKISSVFYTEPVAIYAGAGKSGIYREGNLVYVEREEIKTAVMEDRVRLLVATDAACEGLNLQRLGTLINLDLPWNPSRLEQRLGRIKRIGQVRENVDMLNLVYHGTQDEKIYETISRRMKDRYDIFGSLPDVIEDEWIEEVEKLEEILDKYIHLRNQAKNAFELLYESTIDPDKDRWELCSKVLSRRDISEILLTGW